MVKLLIDGQLRVEGSQVFKVDVVKVVPVTHLLGYRCVPVAAPKAKRGLLALYVQHDLVNLVHTGAERLIKLPVLEELEVLVSIVLIGYLHHKLIDHPLPYYLALEHESVAVLLDFSIVEGALDHVAVELQ